MITQRALIFISLFMTIVGAGSPARAGFWDDMFSGSSAASSGAAAQSGNASLNQKDHQAGIVSRKGRSGQQASSKISTHDQAPTAKPMHFGSPSEAAVAAKIDETLKPGDIVSGTEGLLIYVGDAERSDRRDSFVSAEDKQVKAKLRKQLAAYISHEAPLTMNEHPEKNRIVHSSNNYGIVAANSSAQASVRYIYDQNDKRIRFVGGYSSNW
jgi:hypothetical protein